MSVFALENGRLVPAQAVSTSDAGVTAESIAAIRERVVELLDVPLFPVAWQSEPASDGSRESLIALDPTGQTVTVEVLDYLDADELLSSLARAGRHGEMSRSSLALIYGPGARSFPRDWRLFLDACPPHPSAGPRLYLVVLGIDDAVRSAVDALAGGGLDVRRASLHDGGSQVLVSFEQLRPQPGRLGAILSSAHHYNDHLLDSQVEMPAPDELPLTEETPAAEVVAADVDSVAVEDAAVVTVVAPTAESAAPGNEADPAVPSGIAQDSGEPEEEALESEAVQDGSVEPSEDSDPAEISGPAEGSEPIEDADSVKAPELLHNTETADAVDSADAAQPTDDAEGEALAHAVAETAAAEDSETDAPDGDASVAEEPMAEDPAAEETKADASDEAKAEQPEDAEVLNTETQIKQLKSLLAGEEVPEVPAQKATPRRAHSRRAQVARDKPATESGPDRPVRLDRPDQGAVPSAFANVPGYTGPTAFAQSAAASGSRPEQDLWENSAPKHDSRPTPRIISESSAANFSSEAVQQAADRDQGGAPSRLIQIAQRYGAPFSVVWSQRRRNISLSARVTAWGTIVLPDGRVFTDPSEAASAASGIAGVDGWSVWRVPGGKRLGEL